MEEYFPIITLKNRASASELSAVLEDSSVSIVIEHVDLIDNDRLTAGYRVLVPTHQRQKALCALHRCSGLEDNAGLVLNAA